ncbi:MAG: ABC transporter permease [Miltoncostaeaceae bacterium]
MGPFRGQSPRWVRPPWGSVAVTEQDQRAQLRAASRRGTLALSGREVRRVTKLWSQTIMPPVVGAVLFMVVFGGALGGKLRDVADIPYLWFILPGLLVMTVAGQAFANASTSLYQARNEGYIDDVLTSPLRPAEVVWSYMSGGLYRGWISAVLVAACGLPFVPGVENWLLAIVVLVLTGVIFSALGVMTGIWADSFDQQAFVAALIISPLALLGGVFYSVDALSEPWRTLTLLDPIYYLVDAERGGVTGTHESAVWLSVVVAAVVAGVLTVLAIRMFHRGTRLRP